ncbi:hypothetical protein [Saccharococcus sp. Marseille-Q5394]|uniref:hypothetical protein n=1 Tax=Saccharococcus sp. Marseille-Q5394 TaxID=2972778 RepID=UPI0021C87698|nr:hypothetical protein [Saccharococcus sp. Marseille-Q5394]
MPFKEKDFPAQCPPIDAIEMDINPVYRVIENDTIQEVDFLNHRERNKRYPSHKTCEALAISFFTTYEAANDATIRFKNLRNKKFVQGIITMECGIHKTENEHLNLWLYKDVDMVKVFLGEEDRDGHK